MIVDIGTDAVRVTKKLATAVFFSRRFCVERFFLYNDSSASIKPGTSVEQKVFRCSKGETGNERKETAAGGGELKNFAEKRVLTHANGKK